MSDIETAILLFEATVPRVRVAALASPVRDTRQLRTAP